MSAVLIATVVCVAVAGIIGMCAVPLGSGIPMAGAVALAMCPITAVMVAVNDTQMLTQIDLAPNQLQWLLLIGGLISGLIWAGLTHIILRTTVRSFIVTMRRLAGT